MQYSSGNGRNRTFVKDAGDRELQKGEIPLIARMKKMTLNRKVLVLMTGTFLVIFSLCFLLFVLLFYSREQAQVREDVRAVYHRLENRVNGYMKETDLASVTVMCSTWVQELYTRPMAQTESQQYMNRNNAQGFLSSFSSMYGELDCCIAIAPGDYIKNNLNFQIAQDYDPEQLPWWETFVEEEKYRIFGHNDMFIKNIPDRSVTTYYRIRSIYSLKPIGYFVTNIDYDTFRFLQELLDDDERIRIEDVSGNLVYTNATDEEAQLFGIQEPAGLTNVGGDVLYHDQLMDGNWKIWILKKRRTLSQSLRNNSYVFFLLIPALLVFALVSYLLSRYLSRPIVLCTEALSQVRNENYDVRIPNRYRDEIGDMIDGFNDMAANLGHMMDMNKAMYKARLEAEFRILQQRINPHFLCNTLEMVSGMILSDEGDNALELIGMLGRMYRYDLGENDIATFDEEMSYLENYLSILAYKYPDLQVQYEIDEDVRSCRIPKFVCQPLVENTLKHGFQGRIIGGVLHIEILRRDEQIHISIRDNGRGMDPELKEDLVRKIAELKADQTVAINEHIGLLNTARRLFLLFGPECRFEIRSQVDEGTQIEITIPVMEK